MRNKKNLVKWFGYSFEPVFYGIGGACGYALVIGDTRTFVTGIILSIIIAGLKIYLDGKVDN